MKERREKLTRADKHVSECQRRRVKLKCIHSLILPLRLSPSLPLSPPLLIIPSFDHSLIANNSLRVSEAEAAVSGSLNICGELQMQ